LVWSLPEDGHPRFRDEKWQDAFENQISHHPLSLIKDLTVNLTKEMQTPLFSIPLGTESVPFTVWLEPEALWKRFNTLSQIAILEGVDREEFRAKFDKILAEGKELERNEKGEIACHGVTYLAWTDRL